MIWFLEFRETFARPTSGSAAWPPLARSLSEICDLKIKVHFQSLSAFYFLYNLIDFLPGVLIRCPWSLVFCSLTNWSKQIDILSNCGFFSMIHFFPESPQSTHLGQEFASTPEEPADGSHHLPSQGPTPGYQGLPAYLGVVRRKVERRHCVFHSRDGVY